MDKKNPGETIFSDPKGQLTPFYFGIRSKFKFIQAFMYVLATYRNEEYQIKNEGTRVATTFLPFKSMVIIPDAQGQLTI